MRGAVQLLDAFDTESGGADAFDLRPHGNKAARNIADFGLAGGIFEHGFAFCQRCRHKKRVRGADRNDG